MVFFKHTKQLYTCLSLTSFLGHLLLFCCLQVANAATVNEPVEVIASVVHHSHASDSRQLTVDATDSNAEADIMSHCHEQQTCCDLADLVMPACDGPDALLDNPLPIDVSVSSAVLSLLSPISSGLSKPVHLPILPLATPPYLSCCRFLE